MSDTVYVQIENDTLPPKSEHNPETYNVTGVRGECVQCGRCAVKNPEKFFGGPKTSRKAAVLAVLEELRKDCPHPLPWGSPPVHLDRQIPRGVAVFAVEVTTGDRQAIAVNEKGKLIGSWGGVALTAKVLCVPAADEYQLAAREFAEELVKRGYTCARFAAPEGVTL